MVRVCVRVILFIFLRILLSVIVGDFSSFWKRLGRLVSGFWYWKVTAVLVLVFIFLEKLSEELLK